MPMEKRNLNYLLVIFGQRKTEKQNLFHRPWSDGRQVACDTIQRPKNGLLSNTKGKDVTSFDDYLHLSLMG